MKITYNIIIIYFLLILFPNTVYSKGNTLIENFNEAKYILYNKVHYDLRTTVYCQLEFDKNLNVCLPDDFDNSKYYERSKRIEAEHIVPAENFGKSFKEWVYGSPICNNYGKPYKGRKCAEKASKEYRLMQSDLYNLYPAVGSVNAMRKNYSFVESITGKYDSFGVCDMKIGYKKTVPTEESKGRIARAYLYMEDTYPKRFRMHSETKYTMVKWNEEYPVDEYECKRAKRIENIQGNENKYIKYMCIHKNLW